MGATRRRGAAPTRGVVPAPGAAAVAGVAPPMRFLTDVGELAVVLALDTEPAEVDLTRDGLGDRCRGSGLLRNPLRWL